MTTQLLIFLTLAYSCFSEKWNEVNIKLLSTSTKFYYEEYVKESRAPSSKKDSLIIKPGMGINNIALGKSKISDVLRFQQLKYVVDSGESITDGTDWACHTFWKSYSNKIKGLQFSFESECFMEPNSNPKTYSRALKRIQIHDNNSACFTNGLCIGKATYDDVVKAFGPLPANWKNKHYIALYDKGISLSFDNNLKLFAVEIYSARN